MRETVWARLHCGQNDWTSRPMALPEIATLLANNQIDRVAPDEPCPGPHTILELASINEVKAQNPQEPWRQKGAGPQ